MILTMNVALLLGIIIFVRLGRRAEARSRFDEKMTVVLVLVFGVLIAPTSFGHGVVDVVGQLAGSITQAGRNP
jgi:hypothetical protein